MRSPVSVVGIAAASLCLVSALFVRAAHAQAGSPANNAGWKLPADAAAAKNPLTINDGVLAAGKKLFASKCQRCHGPAGKGDGPDAPDGHAETMDLTSARRAAANPDGIVFHKIWNGRVKPRMPAFSEGLSRDQAWAIVTYVQTLRAPK